MSHQPPPPPGSPAPGAPGQDPGRVLGIVGLVTAFTCFGVVGLVISVLAWRRSRRAGHENTVALLGIVAGAVLTLCWLVVGGFTLLTSLLLDEAMSNGCDVLGPGTHELDDVRYDCP